MSKEQEPKVALDSPPTTPPPPGACGLVAPHDQAEAKKINPSYQKAQDEAAKKDAAAFAAKQ